MPAKVYARPLELFAGMPLSADAFAQELKLLGYRDANCPVEPPAPPPETGKRTIKRKPKPPAPETCVPAALAAEIRRTNPAVTPAKAKCSR